MIFRSVKIVNTDNSLVYSGLVYKLPLKNETVLRKLTVAYGECTICQRRIEAIKRSLYFVLDDYFSGFEEDYPIHISQISPEILDSLEFEIHE